MQKLIAIYYLYKCRNNNPQWKIVLHKAKTGSYYIQRKSKRGYKDKVRVSNHQALNRHKNPRVNRQSWNQKTVFGYYIDERIGAL